MLAGPHAARLRVLDGDRFALDKADTVEAVLALAELEFDGATVEGVVDGPMFRSHAKLGGEFTGDVPNESASLEQEIEQVGQWIDMIAQQAGIAVPVPHTLF